MLFQPTRKVIHRANIKNVGYFQSEKVGRPIVYESILERNFLYSWEFDRNVKSFCEQPVEICYIYNGRTRKYYPDFAIEFKNQVYIIEIKPKEKLNDEKLQPKFEAGISYCKSTGYEYRVLSEDDINMCAVDNIKILFRYRSTGSVSLYAGKIMSLLFNAEQATITDIISKIATSDEESKTIIPIIYNLMSNYLIEFDISKPLNLNSSVWLARTEG